MIYLPIKAQDKVKIQQDGRNRKAEKSALTDAQKRKVMKNVKYNKRWTQQDTKTYQEHVH